MTDIERLHERIQETKALAKKVYGVKTKPILICPGCDKHVDYSRGARVWCTKCAVKRKKVMVPAEKQDWREAVIAALSSENPHDTLMFFVNNYQYG